MRRYRGRKNRSLLTAAAVFTAVAALAAAVAAALLIVPGADAPALGEGPLTILPAEGGGLTVGWPASPDADAYRLYLYDGGAEEYVLQGEYEENTAALPGADLGEKLELKLRAVNYGENILGMTRDLESEERLVAVEPQDLPQPVVTGQTAESRSLFLEWTAAPGLRYEILAQGETLRAVAESGDGSQRLSFGDGGDLPMPSYDQPTALYIQGSFQGEDYVLYTLPSAPVLAEKEALLGNELSLELQETGERCYTLRWNETKGDYYELQEWSREEQFWRTLARLDRDEELSYSTGKLASGSSHRYRVLAIHSAPTEELVDPTNPSYAAIPGEISFLAAISNQYCTVWPLVSLDLMEDAGGTEKLDRVPAGTALCVLEEEGDWFRVRYGEKYGYVDNRYCLINLPEYLGDYCAYDITNSYSSIFRVHEYPITGITGGVVKGYEGIRQEDETSLVPYLYPSSKKLLEAAEAALRDGYRLKIYDAFRPNEATRFLYDTTTLILPLHVPAELDEEGRAIDPATGFSLDPYTGYLIEPETEQLIDPATGYYYDPETGTFTDPVTGAPVDPATLLPPEEQPEGPQEETADGETSGEGDPDAAEGGEPTLPPEEGTAPTEPDEPTETTETTEPTDPAETAEPTLPEESGELTDPAAVQGEEVPPPEELTPTYQSVMTGDRHSLSAFLAASVSNHNRGIALDLTLEDLLTGEELEMQSAMHDLSWNSALYQNNDNAKLLASYMTGAGLKELSSEWWHFQDNANREALGLSGYLDTGLTACGWTRDDTGWRYRAPEGFYYRNTSATIDNRTYAFDSEGYVVE